MNTSGDAAESIVRLSIEGIEVGAKITGSAAKDIAIFLYTILKDNKQTKGKTTLTNMLKSGKELKIFSVKESDFKKFTEEAKKYGVLYCALVKGKQKSRDGIIDIMVKAEDASKINRIVERFNLSSYDSATIRSEINKTREAREKGVFTKDGETIIKEDEVNNPIKKEKSSVNPYLAKTEKSPQSKPSSKMYKETGKGTMPKESVKKKLNDIKKGLERQPKKQIVKTPKIRNNIKGRSK